MVPFSTLDALHFALQLLVSLLIRPDLLGNLFAERGVQLVDKLRNEMLVLQRFLD